MGNNNYTRGAAYERKVKETLESHGWYAVRAAGSHGLTDVVAFDGYGQSYFIQCKTGKSRMSRKDMIALAEIAQKYNAVPVIAHPDTGLILIEWDGETLLYKESI